MGLMYIDHYSFLSDIKLILQTLTVFLKASDSTEAFKQSEESDFFTSEEKSPKADKSALPAEGSAKGDVSAAQEPNEME